MKVRSSAGLLKRVIALEGRKFAQATIASWPKIMDVDEWSELAQPMQEKLCRATREEGSAIKLSEELSISLKD